MHPIKEELTAFSRRLARSWAQLCSRLRKVQRRRALAFFPYRHAAMQNRLARDMAGERLAGEVWETARAIVVQLELPGMNGEDVQVSFPRGQLRIYGNKQRIAGDAQARTYHLKERAFGRFERRIALPHEIDTARAEVS